MRLSDLLEYNHIVIQCHDNPDADSIASGYGVYCYLRSHGKEARLVYGGRNEIRKSNLVMMVKELAIPIEHVPDMDREEAAPLLLTVDCQYGESNVSQYPACMVAAIDHHHRVGKKAKKLYEVRSELGACSTLVWDLLKMEDYPVNEDENLSTALYYGLYTDTGGFDEIFHIKDMELRDEARVDPGLITKLRNSNLSIEELETAGAALLRCDYNEQYRFAIVKSGPCDPNVLGIISDLVLEVDSVDVCVVFSMLPTGVKLSVRSCLEEIKANELANKICMGIGNGGGHSVKAGGYIQMDLLTNAYKAYCRVIGTEPRMVQAATGEQMTPSISAVKSFLEQRLVDYFEGRENVEAVIFDLDGTLLDTLEDLQTAVNVALEQYKMPLRSLEEIRRDVGNGIRKLMERSVPEGENNPDFEEAFTVFKAYYEEHSGDKTLPYDGVMELLHELSGRGIKMGIVSNKFDAGVKELDDRFFGEYTDVALGELPDGRRRKPDPEAVEEVLRILGVSKENALYVGDSEVDILTAKNAGVRCVSATWGFRSEEFLREHEAGIIIHRPLELLEYI